LGALQAAGGTAGYGFSFYAGGFLLLLGVLWGRLACGFLCPFGLLQDLLSKLPVRKRRLYPPLRYVKYVLLVVFVLLLPALLMLFKGVGAPAFCEYICPAGTLEAAVPLLLTHAEYRQAVGGLFALKSVILIAVVIGCLFISRFFCKMLCPLGAIYGLLNRVSICRLHLDEKSCVSCGRCRKVCPMDIDPVVQLHSPECIMCGQCVEACPQKALHLGIKAPAAKTAADSQ
jgi:polyferredoxin